MKFKPLLAVAAAGMGLMVAAGPAFALAGDQAIDDQSPFRLNPYTLEPGCFASSHRDAVDFDDHIDLTALVDGDLVEELHVTVDDDSAYSVDQVLVAGKHAGYEIANTFDTGTSGTDPDVDPNQTAVDLFGPDGSSFIDSGDVIVCVSDHNDNVSNEPYNQEADGMVSAKNRPIIVPVVSCLGVSAIEPLNTYKVGFGYSIERGYVADRFTALFGITDPNAKDTDGDYWPDEVRLNPREDSEYDARRVNDFDQFNEEFVGDIDDYGQTRKFSLDGDLYAWSESNRNDPDTFGSLVTFTAQGDLPLTWTLRASLASSASTRGVTLTLADLTAWENGTGMDVPLCPGTNGPEITPAPPAPPAAPAAPTNTTTNTIEKTTVQTVAGQTVVKKAAKKASKKASCMKKAKAKKSGKAKKKAIRKCRRIK